MGIKNFIATATTRQFYVALALAGVVVFTGCFLLRP